MRAVWIDYGQSPEWAKLAKYGIDAPYFDARDPLTPGNLKEARARTGKGGIYGCWNWQEDLFGGGAGFADWLSAQLQRIAPGSTADSPAVMANIEVHDVAYIVAFCKRWRQHRAARVTDLCWESMQGGLWDGRPDDVQAVLHANMRIFVELYSGEMQPAHPGVTQDLLMSGFPGTVLKGMYAGENLPWRWDGMAYTMGRLPA